MLGPVLRDHMSGLMREHPGELPFCLQPIRQSVRHEYLSARQSERINRFVVVEQRVFERVRCLCRRGPARYFLAYRRNNLTQACVLGRPAVLLHHLRRGLQAERDLCCAVIPAIRCFSPVTGFTCDDP
jgi:hypothetical protein